MRLSAGVERRFRAILCPVDFSEPARTALRYAATIARRSAGHVTVLYVNDPLLIGAAAAVYHRTGLAQRTRAELLRFVRTSIRVSRRHACAGAPGSKAPEGLSGDALAKCRSMTRELRAP